MTNYEVMEFRLLSTDDIFNNTFNDGLAWSRIYEYPLVLNLLKKYANNKEPTIHNTSWGFEGVHVLFKEKLDIFSKNTLHSDIRRSNLPNTTVYNITQPPPKELKNKFEFVLNISTVEEVNYNHITIIENLLDQVILGGYLIITFDYPGLNVNLIESKYKISLYVPPNPINGTNSQLINKKYAHLNCGVFVIKKN